MYDNSQHYTHCVLWCVRTVSGENISFDPSISSKVYSSWNCAYGLFTECLWFFWATLANCSAVVPYLGTQEASRAWRWFRVCMCVHECVVW